VIGRENVLHRNSEDELQHILKKIRLTTLLVGAPGAFLLGLGLYGLFGRGSEAYSFIPVLGDRYFLYGLVAVAAILLILELFLVVPLFRRKSAIEKATNNEGKQPGIFPVARGMGALLFASWMALGAVAIVDGKGIGWASLLLGLLGVYNFASRTETDQMREPRWASRFVVVGGSLCVIAFLALLIGVFFELWW
jgi:hypothetical protein